MIMARYKTGHITTSFSDAAILLRNVGRDVAPEAKLTLGVGEDGKFEYTIEYTDGTSEYGGGKVDGLLKSIS
jgi:hypothetical protein